MQPKTSTHKRVMQLFATLKPLSQRQQEWGENTYKVAAFSNKQGNICAYCGQPMGESLICPVCKGKHTRKADNNRQRVEYTTFNICEAVGEYQVIRTFWVCSRYRKGLPVRRYTNEVCQSWVNDKGTETRVARLKHPMNGTWDMFSDMEIRQKSTSYSYYGDLHEFAQNTDTYPYNRTFLPIFKRNGLQTTADIDKCRCNPVDLLKALLTDPKTETLLKAGYHSLILQRGIEDNWAEIKIAMRHHYKIEDYKLWADTLYLMRHFNMDTHNPQYICSEDIKGLHDRLMMRKQRQEEQERMKRDMERLMQDEKAKADYIRKKGKYFGICITDQELTIEVLKSVEEFIAEGAAMHHCVYTNEYYKDKNTLILSARINGERVETIEVNLKTFKIEQSRGKFNGVTPYHDRIVDLVNENMGQIKAIKRKAA